MCLRNRPVSSTRLILLLVGLFLLPASAIATNEGTSSDPGKDDPGSVTVITIINPRHPSNPSPPDPTPDGATPSFLEVACATLHAGIRRDSPARIALGLFLLGTSSLDEGIEKCRSLSQYSSLP